MTDSPEWLTSLVAGRMWPFMEDEFCNITGFGHRDLQWFADQINLYDLACAGEVREPIESRHLSHSWVVINEEDETFRRCYEYDDGAIPVTVCWNVR